MAYKRRQRNTSDEDRKLADLRWWKAEKPEEAIFATVAKIGRHTRYRQQQDLYFACLYDDSELAALIQGSQAISSFTPQTMTANICKRQADAYVSKMTKNRPVPMALTTGGNFAQQRRAKALTKFFEGILDKVEYFRTRPLRLRDGAIFGSGIAQNYRVGRKLVHERSLPWEWRVDPREARNGKPRSLYRRGWMDRLIAMDRYPKFADKIREAKAKDTEDDWDVGYDETSDLVLFEEAWHLRSDDNEDMEAEDKEHDGAHAICFSNCTPVHDAYERDYFPISKNDYSPPVTGWWGEGMIKQLAGLQFEVNAIGLRLQEQGYMTGSYVLVEDGSGIETDTLDNGALTVVRYQGSKPEWQNPAPWHPQFFDYYQALRGPFAADLTGISQLATRSEKPAGLESGKALRTYHDIESEAFITQGREDERDVCDTAWQFFDLMEEIHGDTKEDGTSYEIKVENKRHGRTANDKLSYKDVRMDKEEFTLRTFPTSFLASTPEDRWDQVAEMAKAGLFSQDEMLALLDFPDLQKVLDLRGAPRRVIEAIMEKLLSTENPKPIAPEPTMNLDLCIVLGTLGYLEAKWIDEAPDSSTQALLDFVLAAKDLKENPPGDKPLPPPGQQPQLPDPAPPLYAPPPTQPLPPNAVPPAAMPPMPQV